MMRQYRFAWGALVAVIVSATIGGTFGKSALATQDRIPDYKVFTAALGAVESRYIDKAESDRLVYSSIAGMLQTLDPHSSFMDPRTYAQLRERQEGRYYGLGISIVVTFDGDITVMNLFEGSPAYKAGIRRGDVIALIIFGPRKLPELGKTLGKSLAEFRRASNDLRSTLEEEIRLDEQKTPPAAVRPAPLRDAEPVSAPVAHPPIDAETHQS
jgi:TatA/E family protein of Tat protein translocase